MNIQMQIGDFLCIVELRWYLLSPAFSGRPLGDPCSPGLCFELGVFFHQQLISSFNINNSYQYQYSYGCEYQMRDVRRQTSYSGVRFRN